MAPILKELDAPTVASGGAPSVPQSKPANEGATRTQPVALEIPVTVNGARTVEGSDKRVPFSETTQTVLLFPHGAVVKVATPLNSGQLVFLTNEKSKKEVVCQVVKSKTSGTAGAYVELQFTEPSPGFWGPQVAGPSTVTSRPVSPVPTPKPVNPAPAAAKPVAPKVATPATPIGLTTPAVIPPVSHKPAGIAPPPSPVASSVVTPTLPAVPIAPIVTPPIQADPPRVKPLEQIGTTQQIDVMTPASVKGEAPATPAVPLQDYSKEIAALFAPQAPAQKEGASTANATPASNDNSTEELKQQAARLQAQLSSLLFTETPVKPTTAAPDRTAHQAEKPSSTAEAKQKITQDQLAVVRAESKPSASIPVASVASLAKEEEVKIPSWLAPLSQASEVVSESPAVPALDEGAPAEEAVSAESNHVPTTMFGGQLLGDTTGSAAEGVSSGSRKGLILGLVAAAVLAAGGWYYYQGHVSSRVPASTASASPAAVTATEGASPENPAPSESTVNKTVPALSSAAHTPKNTVPTAPISTPTETPAAKESRAAARPAQPEPAPEKPALGDVRLAAPVVNRSTEQHSLSDSGLTGIATKSVPQSGGPDPFGGSAVNHNAPAAPLPVGGDVKPAELIKTVAPEYPAIARTQRISGKVQIDALIDASGNVASEKIVSGPALLHRSALDAVRQWKYKPAMLDGEPTSMHLTVTVEFKAQ